LCVMKKSTGGYWPIVQSIMATLPGATEGISYRTPSYSVSKKFLLRLLADDITIALYMPDRDEWTKKDPVVFYITPHYQNYPAVLVDLSKVKRSDLVSILTEAWRSRAGKKFQDEFERRK
jgi:hypothetical protein